MTRLFFATAIVLFVPTIASAATPEASRRAEALFQEGRRLMESGDFAGACPLLKESLALDRTPGTLLNLAACHEGEGKTASAWREFDEVIREATKAGRDEVASVARRRAADLAKKIHRLSLDLPKHAGLEVRLDGNTLETSTPRSALAIDPGEHTLEVRADRCAAPNITINVGGAPGVISVTVPPLVCQGDAPRAAPQGTPPSLPVLAVSAGALAVAGIGVGSYFGLRTFSKESQSNRECDPSGECSQRGVDLRREASSSSIVSTTGFAVGLIATGILVYALVTRSPARSAVTRAGVSTPSRGLWGFDFRPVW